MHRLATASLAAPLGVLAATGAATALVATVSPEEPGHYPTCPSLTITGWWCPGCGSLRAIHALAHGDLGTALERNILTVAAIPVLVVAWLLWVRKAALGVSLPVRPVPTGAVWGLLVVILVFWVVRNMPGGEWLAPPPA